MVVPAFSCEPSDETAAGLGRFARESASVGETVLASRTEAGRFPAAHRVCRSDVRDPLGASQRVTLQTRRIRILRIRAPTLRPDTHPRYEPRHGVSTAEPQPPYHPCRTISESRSADADAPIGITLCLDGRSGRVRGARCRTFPRPRARAPSGLQSRRATFARFELVKPARVCVAPDRPRSSAALALAFAWEPGVFRRCPRCSHSRSCSNPGRTAGYSHRFPPGSTTLTGE